MLLHRITTALACPLVPGCVVFGTQTARAASIWTDRVSVSSSGAQANDASCCGVVSGDGRFVAFDSSATNLSVHPDTNGVQDDHVDVFVRDVATGRTTRVSDTPGGAQGTADAGRASISANGRFVIIGEAYGSACGRYGVFVKDRSADTLKLVSRKSTGAPMCRFPTPCGPSGQVSGGHVTNNGHLVTFEVRFRDDACGVGADVVVRDRSAGHTHIFDGISVDSDVSPDGRFLVWAAGPLDGH